MRELCGGGGGWRGEASRDCEAWAGGVGVWRASMGSRGRARSQGSAASHRSTPKNSGKRSDKDLFVCSGLFCKRASHNMLDADMCKPKYLSYDVCNLSRVESAMSINFVTLLVRLQTGCACADEV